MYVSYISKFSMAAGHLMNLATQSALRVANDDIACMVTIDYANLVENIKGFIPDPFATNQ